MAWREKNKITYFGKKEIEKRQPTVQVPKLYEKKYCSGSKTNAPRYQRFVFTVEQWRENVIEVM